MRSSGAHGVREGSDGEDGEGNKKPVVAPVAPVVVTRSYQCNRPTLAEWLSELENSAKNDLRNSEAAVGGSKVIAGKPAATTNNKNNTKLRFHCNRHVPYFCIPTLLLISF